MSKKAANAKIKKQKQILDNYTKIVIKAQGKLEEKLANISNPSQYVSTVLQLSSYVVPKKNQTIQEPEESRIKFIISNNESIII